MTIERNVSIKDSVYRLIVVIAFGLTAGMLQSITIGIIGAIVFITMLAGWCPIYSMFGIDSCKRDGV